MRIRLVDTHEPRPSVTSNDDSENVAVVNEAFVRRFFKSDEDPLDQHFGLNLPERPREW
jgi:hypothetical protein